MVRCLWRIVMSDRAKTFREEEHALIQACRDGRGTMYGQEELADVVAALADECEAREQNERAEMCRADEYQTAYRLAERDLDAIRHGSANSQPEPQP